MTEQEKTQHVTKVSLDETLHGWLKEEAGRRHCPVAQALRQIVVEARRRQIDEAAERRMRLTGRPAVDVFQSSRE